ncbi:ShlB/FhaC/HecB family hemolysin secretion/activation protein [Hydrogenophaga sp. PAMC20947]|uniref:ShlB/FhaC/HecB family hemolysin secretion/activation protein n=1 Tax=Hydrogenophaga sp. PAMC20947 TaxID=2565558 RepID=UPI00109E19A6|nr:ShlB/FhaC/HecB family hemolysin secretion/activation protein [Hydrogenophaga sp. PAMC20947]QCB46257.1 ShlB/FhaC/HecB family hemolysin secretion/activation protein [Hydrogenophaga sp. PAMC20947]
MTFNMTTVAIAALFSGAVYAQVVLPPSADPGAIQQRRLDEEQRRLEQERLERVPSDGQVRQVTPAPAPAAPEGGPKFMVRDISFSPASEVFSAEELGALVQNYKGKEATFGELQEMAERINAAYRERGVVTARAIIPPQDISSGTITLQLVEGKLGAINLKGNESTRDSYILSRVQAENGTLVDLPSLQSSLLRFNRTNSAQLRAGLEPGQSFGTTDLVIDVQEPKQHAFRIGLDNLGSDVTGKTRLGLAYANQSLLGWRDTLNLAVMSAEGLKSYSLTYAVPVTTSGGRLSLAHSQDDTKLKNGPFASLDITGASSSTSLTMRQPVYFGERSQFDVMGSVRRRSIENQISGLFLSGTDVDDVQLGVEYQSGDDAGYWLANYMISSGRATTAAVDSRFTVGRAALRRTHFLGTEGWALRGALSLQHTSSESLPASEQMFLGGEGSVRGYSVGAVSGDQGSTLSLELLHPITGRGAGAGGSAFAADGFFFLDAGYVKITQPPESILPRSQTLTSVGWGVNMSLGKHVSANLTLGYALKELAEESQRYKVGLQLTTEF